MVNSQVAGKLLYQISADSRQFATELKTANDQLDKTSQRANSTTIELAKIATVSAVVASSLVALGSAAVASATEFQRHFSQVETLIPAAASRIAELQDNVRALAISTGKDTADLTQGLYQVVSAFGDSTEAAKQLELAAKAATAGGADTSAAISLLSAVTKGFGDTSLEAQKKVADLAFLTVKLGQTSFPELASSMGRVVPLATQLGVSQEELFAVMATATGVTGTASEVTTQLAGVFQALLSPTASLSALISELGYANSAALLETEGLHGALLAIKKAVDDNNSSTQAYIGSQEGQVLALTLAGNQSDTYTTKLSSMLTTQDSLNQAYTAATEGVGSFAHSIDQSKAAIEVLSQKIGEQLQPLVADLLKPIQGLATSFAEMSPEATETAGAIVRVGTVAATASALIAGLALATRGLKVAFLTLGKAGPIGLIITGIATLGSVVWELTRKFRDGAYFSKNLGSRLEEINGKGTELVGTLRSMRSEHGELITLSERYNEIVDQLKKIYPQLSDAQIERIAKLKDEKEAQEALNEVIAEQVEIEKKKLNSKLVKTQYHIDNLSQTILLKSHESFQDAADKKIIEKLQKGSIEGKDIPDEERKLLQEYQNAFKEKLDTVLKSGLVPDFEKIFEEVGVHYSGLAEENLKPDIKKLKKNLTYYNNVKAALNEFKEPETESTNEGNTPPPTVAIDWREQIKHIDAYHDSLGESTSEVERQTEKLSLLKSALRNAISRDDKQEISIIGEEIESVTESLKAAKSSTDDSTIIDWRKQIELIDAYHDSLGESTSEVERQTEKLSLLKGALRNALSRDDTTEAASIKTELDTVTESLEKLKENLDNQAIDIKSVFAQIDESAKIDLEINGDFEQESVIKEKLAALKDKLYEFVDAGLDVNQALEHDLGDGLGTLAEQANTLNNELQLIEQKNLDFSTTDLESQYQAIVAQVGNGHEQLNATYTQLQSLLAEARSLQAAGELIPTELLDKINSKGGEFAAHMEALKNETDANIENLKEAQKWVNAISDAVVSVGSGISQLWGSLLAQEKLQLKKSYQARVAAADAVYNAGITDMHNKALEQARKAVDAETASELDALRELGASRESILQEYRQAELDAQLEQIEQRKNAELEALGIINENSEEAIERRTEKEIQGLEAQLAGETNHQKAQEIQEKINAKKKEAEKKKIELKAKKEAAAAKQKKEKEDAEKAAKERKLDIEKKNAQIKAENEYQKRLATARRSAAEAQKVIDIAIVASNLAKGITAAAVNLATPITAPYFPIAVGAMIASTALQTAAILAQPLPEIPEPQPLIALAKGGIFPATPGGVPVSIGGSTAGIIAEAGTAEIALPLTEDNLRAVINAAGAAPNQEQKVIEFNPVVNISVNTQSLDEDSLEEMAETLHSVLRRYQEQYLL